MTVFCKDCKHFVFDQRCNFGPLSLVTGERALVEAKEARRGSPYNQLHEMEWPYSARCGPLGRFFEPIIEEEPVASLAYGILYPQTPRKGKL